MLSDVEVSKKATEAKIYELSESCNFTESKDLENVKETIYDDDEQWENIEQSDAQTQTDVCGIEVLDKVNKANQTNEKHFNTHDSTSHPNNNSPKFHKEVKRSMSIHSEKQHKQVVEQSSVPKGLGVSRVMFPFATIVTKF